MIVSQSCFKCLIVADLTETPTNEMRKSFKFSFHVLFPKEFKTFKKFKLFKRSGTFFQICLFLMDYNV